MELGALLSQIAILRDEGRTARVAYTSTDAEWACSWARDTTPYKPTCTSV